MSARPAIWLDDTHQRPHGSHACRVDTAQRIVDDSEDFIFAELLWEKFLNDVDFGSPIAANLSRPALSNWLIESRRCLTILSMIASALASSISDSLVNFNAFEFGLNQPDGGETLFFACLRGLSLRP